MQHNIQHRLVHHLQNNFRARDIPCSGDSSCRRWYCPHNKSRVRVRSRQQQHQRRHSYCNCTERFKRDSANLRLTSLYDVQVTHCGSCNNILYVPLLEHVFPRNSVFLVGKRSNAASIQVDSILQRHRRSSHSGNRTRCCTCTSSTLTIQNQFSLTIQKRFTLTIQKRFTLTIQKRYTITTH